MKTLKLMVLSLSVLLSTSLYASGDKGNGGDGVILEDGSVVLYDYFERSIDPDKALNKAKPVATRWNFSIDKAIPQHNGRQGGDLWNGKDAQAIHNHLVLLFHSFGGELPKLAIDLIKEIDTLRWVQAAVDLEPNEDTASHLDQAKFKRIGCARTEAGVVLYSPSCGGAKMSSGNKAGLILHEAFYSYLKRLVPTTNSSFSVRSFNEAIFRATPFAKATHKYLQEVLQNAGLGEELTQNQNIMGTFFDGRYAHVKCTFNNVNQPLKKFELTFLNAVTFKGVLQNKNKSETEQESLILGRSDNAKGVTQENMWDYNGWIASLPEFNLTDQTVTLLLKRSDSERVRIRFQYTGDDSDQEQNAAFADYYNSESETEITDILGYCSKEL